MDASVVENDDERTKAGMLLLILVSEKVLDREMSGRALCMTMFKVESRWVYYV